MSSLRRTLAAAALSLATLLPAGYAGAADLTVKAPKPVADVPFFFVIDDRVWTIMHGVRADQENIDGSKNKDPNGKLFSVEMVKKLVP